MEPCTVGLNLALLRIDVQHLHVLFSQRPSLGGLALLHILSDKHDRGGDLRIGDVTEDEDTSIAEANHEGGDIELS